MDKIIIKRKHTKEDESREIRPSTSESCAIDGGKTCGELASSSKGQSKKRKTRPIQDEHRKFNDAWTEEFLFVAQGTNSLCLICQKLCSGFKRGNLERHLRTTHASFNQTFPLKSNLRKKKIEELSSHIAGQQRLIHRTSTVAENLTEATYEIAWILAKHKKPFTDAEVVKECFLASAEKMYCSFSNEDAILKQIRGLQLSDTTIMRRTEEIGNDIRRQLIADLSAVPCFSIALDESTDICDVAQLCVWEALVAKLKDGELQKVMQLVVRVVNFIVSRALNHRQFHELLAEFETEYGDLVMHNEVRWLSRGRVLDRFLSLLPQIREFTSSKGRVEPELENPEWIMKLALLTDLTCHLNALNLKLQGCDKHPAGMLGVVTAFQNKITSLFIPDRQFVHFPNLRKTTLANPDMLQSFSYDTFENTLKDLGQEFESRFMDVMKYKEFFTFIETPFNVHVSTLSPILDELCPDRASVESEIVELQANETLKAVLKSGEENFWHIVPDMDYPTLKQTVQKVMCYFVSTYTCESTFSTMNIVKGKQRNRVTSGHLDILTRIAVTNYKFSMEKVKEQLTHFRSSQH
ncbi:general transcription factor II-I repeat domain-containing protein 2A-like [Penaeus indicus]|uniref:general transcription factor II-I repeat domain-containing protein 2A-like n=1 Tax=Penaeus indicus TaxID=29960 RepID=UPI00300D7BF1